MSKHVRHPSESSTMHGGQRDPVVTVMPSPLDSDRWYVERAGTVLFIGTKDAALKRATSVAKKHGERLDVLS